MTKKASAISGLGAESSFSVTVDYVRTVEEMIEAGRYDLTNSGITSENFPSTRIGTANIVVEMIHFNRTISTNEACGEFERVGRRGAELRQLLAFGESYPDVQREFPVVALGSVWRWGDPRGSSRVPYLSGHLGERYLHLSYFGRRWRPHYRFATVRK